MHSLIWKRVERYFLPTEPWGEPEKISGLLLMTLYQLRCSSGWPVIIHCGTQGLHCKNSYHYRGLAVDFHFQPPGDISFHSQIRHLLSFLADMQLANSVGLGVYPQWHHPGFHFDVRGYKARWSQLQGRYVSFEEGLSYVRDQ